jgi:hypothetical protein
MNTAQFKDLKEKVTQGQGSSVNFRFAITLNAYNNSNCCCCKL